MSSENASSLSFKQGMRNMQSVEYINEFFGPLGRGEIYKYPGSQKRWMTDLKQRFPDFGLRLIREVAIPGAHHAGFTHINPLIAEN